MNKKRVDFLFEVWDLTQTINQALEYLKTNPDNSPLLEDVSAGLQTLYGFCQDSAKTGTLLTLCHTKLFSALETTAENNVSEIFDYYQKKIASTISLYVVEELTKELNSEPYLDAECAKRFFTFWDKAPHRFSAAYQLLFDVCSQCSLTAPKESFDYSIKFLEEVPDALSDERSLHPGYVYTHSPQRTFEHCPICNGEGTPYFRSFPYRMKQFDAPNLPVKLWMKCTCCENLYTWKFPEEFLQLSGHSELILPDSSKYIDTIRPTLPDSILLNIWCNILDTLHSYTNGSSLLEVGVGNGDLLAVALELGYDADAVELFPESATHVSNMLGIPVHCCDFLNYTTKKSYDIITMGDVIEHVSNPALALQKANQLLKPNGVLWLSTPNFESAFTRMTKFQDAMWNEAFHITYFSRKGFEKLAKEAGFEIIKHTVSNRYNGSMELILRKMH